MILQLSEIARRVRVALDLNAQSAPLISEGDLDTLTLNEIIVSKILEAVRLVHLEAPYHLLETGHNIGNSQEFELDNDEIDNDDIAITWESEGVGYIALNSDFMRLVVFQMSDWDRPVYNPISVDSVEYAMQRNKYKGLRGTPQHPVCAIAMRPGGRVLEFYSCVDNNATVSRAVYIPYPAIDHEGIDISEHCVGAVIYKIAELVSATYGDANKTAYYGEIYKSLLK